MTTSIPDSPPLGKLLRGYRQKAGLTQGQFIEKLSFLINEIDADDRSALEQVDVHSEAVAYFSGVLDSPTLSRLEKGKRVLNSRHRCLAFVWGLNRLGVLTGSLDANLFLKAAGHRNLTGAESRALLGLFEDEDAVVESPVSAGYDDDPVGRDTAANGEGDGRDEQDRQVSVIVPDRHEPPKSSGGLTVSHALLAIAALALAAAAGWAIRGGVNESDLRPAAPAVDQQSHVLLVDDLRSVTGEIGRDQTHTSLHEKDQRNDSDDWTRHVKFIPDDAGTYLGYRAYHLPDHIPIDSITGLQLEVNYRGPDYEAAPWVWEVERKDTTERRRLGDNRESQWWSKWTESVFAFPAEGDNFDASLYLRDGQFWILLAGKNGTETFDMDYEALVIKWTDADSD